jgi:hypothetical protein
MKCK